MLQAIGFNLMGDSVVVVNFQHNLYACLSVASFPNPYFYSQFLEGGHIVQLARYLEALHDVQLASSDHLILLLNCYARLQDESGIDRFIKAADTCANILDVSAAVRVLRQANFFHAAFLLAEKFGRCGDQICILIDDLDDCTTALNRIAEFPFDEALRAVCSHGHLLMDRLANETVILLDKLCSHKEASRINVHHFLKVFINNREGLLQFLRHYITTAECSIKITGVVDALLELLLYEASRLVEEMKEPLNMNVQDRSEKKRLCQSLWNSALELLQNDQLPYDAKKALLQCHRRGFIDGCIYLWEKQKLYDQLLKYYMDSNSNKLVLETCRRFGQDESNLWLSALKYFGSKPEFPDDLHEVVSEIDKLNLVSPLAVLRILSETTDEESCSLGAIRDYFLRHLENGVNQITAMQREVQQLRDETMRNREVVRSLSSQVKIFQQQKCALCHQSLEPPSVNFLCDHSYHKLCFENYSYGDQQCPECAPRNKKLLSTISEHSNLMTASKSPNSGQTVTNQLRNSLHHGVTGPESGHGIPTEPLDTLASMQVARLLATRPMSPTNAVSTAPKERIPLVTLTGRDNYNPSESAKKQTASHPVIAEVQPQGNPFSSSGYHSAPRGDFPNPSTSSMEPTRNPFGHDDDDIDDVEPPQSIPTVTPFDEPHPLVKSLNPFDD